MVKKAISILISDENVFTETVDHGPWCRNNRFHFSPKENNRLSKAICHQGVNLWWKFSKIHLADFFSGDFVAPILIARRSLILGLIGRLSFFRIDDGFKCGVIILRFLCWICPIFRSPFSDKNSDFEREIFISKMEMIFFDQILDIPGW